VQGNNLKIVSPEWLSGMLRIEEGDLVSIEKRKWQAHVRSVNARPFH
jgi:hypothetical protein